MRKSLEILVAAVVLFESVSPVVAVIEFNNGQVHNIDYRINDNVRVDYESPSLGTTLNFLDEARTHYYWLEAWEDSIINILGGLMNYNVYAHDSSQIAVSGGSIHNINAYDNSHVTVSGRGVLKYDLLARDSSQIDVSGGVMNMLWAYDNSQVTVSGGAIHLIRATFSSQATISGGSMDTLYAYDSSQVTVSGGTIANWLVATDNSRVSIAGGSMYELTTGVTSQVDISGGVIEKVFRARGSSQVAVSGGSIDAISTYDNSQVTISDGLLNRNLYAYDNSQVTVSGGLFEGELLVLVDSAVLTIHGSDFAVDSMPVGYTDLYSIFGGSYKYEPYRQLTGTLLNGEPFDNDFRIGELGRIVLVPEPTTLLLLGLGGLALMRGRKQA